MPAVSEVVVPARVAAGAGGGGLGDGLPDPLRAGLGQVEAWADAAAGEPVWRLGDAGLSEALGRIGRVRAVMAALELALVGEVVSRGTASAEGFSVVDWVRRAVGSRAPLPPVGQVSAVVTVARAVADRVPGSGDVAAGVASTALPVGKAAQIVRFAVQAGKVADEEDLREWVAGFVVGASDELPGVGAGPGGDGEDGDGEASGGEAGDGARRGAGESGDGDGDGEGEDGAGGDGVGGEGVDGHRVGEESVGRGPCRGVEERELARHLARAARLVKPARDLEDLERRQRLARSLTRTDGGLSESGMASYRMVLDPEGAAVVDSAVAALSAPRRAADGGLEPGALLDPRSAATRRADALLDLVGRAVAAGGALAGPVSSPTDPSDSGHPGHPAHPADRADRAGGPGGSG